MIDFVDAPRDWDMLADWIFDGVCKWGFHDLAVNYRADLRAMKIDAEDRRRRKQEMFRSKTDCVAVVSAENKLVLYMKFFKILWLRAGIDELVFAIRSLGAQKDATKLLPVLVAIRN